MESFNDPLLVFWRALGDWGLVVVIISVIGEVAAAAAGSILEKLEVANFKKWESRLKRYEIIAGWILVIGLAMEYKGHREETLILDSNNAALYNSAKQAEQKAGEAFKLEANAIARASKFDAERAKFENEAELTRSNNLILSLELKKSKEPRTITPKQISDFIFLTKKIAKIPLKIALPSGRLETINYASQIRNMFNNAGYFPETNSGIWGINIDSTVLLRRAIIADAKWPDVAFYVYGTNEIFYAKNFNFEYTNGFTRPIVTETNNEIIGSAIMFVFNQIGITTEQNTSSQWVKSGEIEFFIMDRAN